MAARQPVFTFQAANDGFTIFRDDKPLETPRNLAVTVPTQKLAEAIVAECGGQGEKLDLRKMPLTQMALTSIDISGPHRDEVVAGIMRYGETELVCLRASEPAELVAEQSRVWQPYLDWLHERFAVHLVCGTGVSPVKQEAQDLAILKNFIVGLDVFRLTGLSEAVGVSGSMVLGLALATGHAEAKHVLAAAELDQIWQSRKWGQDPAVEARHKAIKTDLEMCANWFGLVG